MASSGSVFEELIVTLQTALDRLLAEDPSGIVIYDTPSREQFWATLRANSKAHANNVNVVAIAFRSSPPPKPEETRTMCKKIEKSIGNLVEAYTVLSPLSGKGYISSINGYVTDILKCTLLYFSEYFLSEQVPVLPEISFQQLGKIWEACEKIETLPKSQVDYAFNYITKQTRLLNDAMTEIDNELKRAQQDQDGNLEEEIDDEFSGPKYSPRDFKLIAPAIGLLKTTCVMSRKLCQAIKSKGNCDTEQAIKEIDELCLKCSKLSPIVDELVMTLYPPIQDLEETGTFTQVLSSTNEDIIKHVEDKHYMTPDQQTWLDTVKNALQHNTSNLRMMLMERGISSLTL